MQALAGGEVVAVSTVAADIRAVVQAGKARLLAVAGEQRDPTFPDVPTLPRTGLPDLVAQPWYGLFAPAGTPKGPARPAAQGRCRCGHDPVVHKRLLEMGLEPTGHGPDRLAKAMKADYERWGPMIRASGFKPERHRHERALHHGRPAALGPPRLRRPPVPADAEHRRAGGARRALRPTPTCNQRRLRPVAHELLHRPLSRSPRRDLEPRAAVGRRSDARRDSCAAPGCTLALAGKTHVMPDTRGLARAAARRRAASSATLLRAAASTRSTATTATTPPGDESGYADYLRAHGYDGADPWTDYVIAASDRTAQVASAAGTCATCTCRRACARKRTPKPRT